MKTIIIAAAAALLMSVVANAHDDIPPPAPQPTIDDYMRRQTEAMESIAADLKVAKRLMFNNCLESLTRPHPGKPNPY